MATWKKVLYWIAAILIFLYIALVAGLLLASWVLVPEELRGLLRTIATHGLVLSPILFVFALLTRQKDLIRLMGAAVMALLIVWAPRVWGSTPVNVVEDATEVTVMTFNIQAAKEGIGTEVEIMLDEDPDVIAIQELSVEASEYFLEHLGDRYPFEAMYPTDPGYRGQGVLSKFPIVEQYYWTNDQLVEHLGHMYARLDINGQDVHLFSAHPVPPFSLRDRMMVTPHSIEVESIVERANELDGPVILAGDFNMTPDFDVYRDITAVYWDAWAESSKWGFGFTNPRGKPVSVAPPSLRLDYIFYNSYFAVIDARVVPESGVSDHAPVWARLALLTRNVVR